MTAMIENGDGQGKELQNQLVASVEQLIDDSGWAEQLDSFLRDKLKEEQDLQQNSQQDSLPVYLTPKQAAKQFGYPPVTLSKWAAQGLIEYKKNERGNKLYLQSSLEEKVAKTSRQPSQEPEQTREPSHQLDSDEQLIDGSVVTEPERFREDMEDKLKQEELEQTVGSAVILNQLYSNSNNEIANIIMAQLNQNLAEYKDEVVDGIKVYIDEKLQDLYTENQELKNELKAYIEASRQPLNKHKPGFFSTISRKV
jgi:DNA-binding transcriptional MerR regulator